MPENLIKYLLGSTPSLYSKFDSAHLVSSPVPGEYAAQGSPWYCGDDTRTPRGVFTGDKGSWCEGREEGASRQGHPGTAVGREATTDPELRLHVQPVNANQTTSRDSTVSTVSPHASVAALKTDWGGSPSRSHGEIWDCTRLPTQGSQKIYLPAPKPASPALSNSS